MKRAQKAIVIGLDAPIAHRLVAYARAGKLPALGKLIANGVYAENCLVPYPTVTPQNWTTLATGASLGTHGITGFQIHKPGEPFSELHTAFDSSLCEAEYVWDAAERAGKRSIVINWPCIWPPTVKKGWQLGGAGLAVNNWRSGPYWPDLEKATWADIQLFSTADVADTSRIELTDAAGWRGMDGSGRCRAAELKHRYSACTNRGAPGLEHAAVTGPAAWHMLVRDTAGAGYDRALLCTEKDAATAFATLRPGEWTGTLVHEFATVDGPRQAAFRCKLLELSAEGDRVTLLLTPLCAMEGYSYPDALAAETAAVNPLALPMKSCTNAYNWGWFDEATYLEFVEMESEWFADVGVYLMQNKPWDLFFMHNHAPDWLYHRMVPIPDMDPARDPARAEHWTAIDVAMYRSMDRMIARLVEAAGDDALVIVVSDHGAKGMGRSFSAAEALAEAGLTEFTTDPATGATVVDCASSRAVPATPAMGPWVYVNLEGRDPGGIVDAADYDRVCDEIVRALCDYEDLETGDRPVALALPRRDARPLGLHGDRVGDVVYATTAAYGGNHGGLPTSGDNVGSLHGLFIMAGPGVKKGAVLERTVGLADVVPTLCHLTNTPEPRDAEGAVIRQALADPDAKTKELEKLRKRHDALRKSLGDTSFDVDQHR